MIAPFFPIQVERIIFCTYRQSDWDLYCNLLPYYFPPQLGTESGIDRITHTHTHTHKVFVHNYLYTGNFAGNQVCGSRLSELEKRMNTVERRAEEERARAEAAEQRLMQKSEMIQQLQQQTEEQGQEIYQLSELVVTHENRIRELEQSLAESQQCEVQLEQELHQTQLQLTNSDRVFQDIFQRLLGQLPQSLPHWVMQRDEIQLTNEQLGTGGWATVKVALFRGQRVAAKCLHNQIISPHNIRLFTREMNMAARARHPNLLQFIGATMDNNPIILTELMPTSLRRVLEQGNPLTRKQIVSIASDVA